MACDAVFHCKELLSEILSFVRPVIWIEAEAKIEPEETMRLFGCNDDTDNPSYAMYWMLTYTIYAWNNNAHTFDIIAVSDYDVRRHFGRIYYKTLEEEYKLKEKWKYDFEITHDIENYIYSNKRNLPNCKHCHIIKNGIETPYRGHNSYSQTFNYKCLQQQKQQQYNHPDTSVMLCNIKPSGLCCTCRIPGFYDRITEITFIECYNYDKYGKGVKNSECDKYSKDYLSDYRIALEVNRSGNDIYPDDCEPILSDKNELIITITEHEYCWTMKYIETVMDNACKRACKQKGIDWNDL